MKKIHVLLLVIISCVLFTSCKEKEFNEAKGELVIGLECDYAPFNWTEMTKTESNYPISNVKNAYAEGYDVQMAKKIADALGYTLVIKKIKWDGLVPALKSGAIDCIIAGMSPTADRKLQIDFTDGYYTSKHVLVGLSTSEYISAKTFNDLSGAKVIGQKNTLYDTLALQCATRNTSVTHLTALDTVPLIVNAIKTGVADLTILEEPVAKGLLTSNPELAYFSLTDTFEVSEEDVVVAIGVRKVDTVLKGKINQVLSTITSQERDSLMDTAVLNS